jgi:SAM-dependent methyltransferase
VSNFSAVDESPDPARLSEYLDAAAVGLAPMKYYALMTHLARRPNRVLDIGCGGGHDLALLEAAGVTVVGADPSRSLLDKSAARLQDARLIQSDGQHIALRDESVDGCRIERVLQHVADPGGVVDEAVRCTKVGGVITIFEPDWSTFRIPSDVLGDDASILINANHPAIGGRLRQLLEDRGCVLVDLVTEQSFTRQVDDLNQWLPLDRAVERAVAAGRIIPKDGATWLDEQRARDAEGSFVASLTKILAVAVRARGREEVY